jgi:hypothetical protein
MTRPVVSAPSERLYGSLGYMTVHDPENGWLLLLLCAAIANGALDVVEEYATPQDDDGYGDEFLPTFGVTQPGWSQILDPDRCPTSALPYLGQFVGVQVDGSLTEQGQRDQIRAASGMRRGTPASIVAAAQLWMNGSRTVALTERYTASAYALKVRVHAGEVVDVAKFTASVTGAVPAGIVLTLDLATTWIWDDVETLYTGLIWDDVETDWTAPLTYADFETEDAP